VTPAISLGLAAVYTLSFVGKRGERQRVEDYLRPVAGHLTRVLARLVLIVEGVLCLAFLAATVIVPAASWLAMASILFVMSATAFHAGLLARRQSARCRCFGELRSADAAVDDAWRPALLWLRNGAIVLLSAALLDANPALPVGLVAGVAVIIASGLLTSIIGEHVRIWQSVHPLMHAYARQVTELQAQSWWVNGHPRAL
jgi:hypothetical protein